MATCRVYLCTYRRNALLPRALKSLLNQTFEDWVCELHNDDPTDPFPRQLVQEIGDPRVQVIDHPQNMGPMAVFNLVFRKVEEEFVSLLEDDNWWEPNFLERMIEVMCQNPTSNIAWANMRFWQEAADGSWKDTGKNIWEQTNTETVKPFWFPDRRQIFGALHSQGAMFVRSQFADRYQVPDETTSAAGEHVRERVFDYPILFVPQILGNYALTKGTSRSENRATWGAIQILLAGSFFKNVPVKADTLNQIWREARTPPARSTGVLLLIGLIFPDCRKLLRYAKIEDWLFFIASWIKRPIANFEMLQLVHSNRNLWFFLDQSTALKFQEAKRLGFESI